MSFIGRDKCTSILEITCARGSKSRLTNCKLLKNNESKWEGRTRQCEKKRTVFMPALIAFVTELIITGTVEDLVNKGGLAEMVLGWELVVRTSLENFSELEHIDKHDNHAVRHDPASVCNFQSFQRVETNTHDATAHDHLFRQHGVIARLPVIGRRLPDKAFEEFSEI